MNFTVKEINIICIYLRRTRALTIENILDELPKLENDFKCIAESAVQKLKKISDEEFLEFNFKENLTEDNEPQGYELEPSINFSQKEMERTDLIISDISAFTGISVKQLQSMPEDILEEIINTYSNGIGVVDNNLLKNYIDTILGMKSSAPENHLKTVEELIEGNCNSIDGIINNSRPETFAEEKPSVLEQLSLYKFSELQKAEVKDKELILK